MLGDFYTLSERKPRERRRSVRRATPSVDESAKRSHKRSHESQSNEKRKRRPVREEMASREDSGLPMIFEGGKTPPTRLSLARMTTDEKREYLFPPTLVATAQYPRLNLKRRALLPTPEPETTPAASPSFSAFESPRSILVHHRQRHTSLSHTPP